MTSTRTTRRHEPTDGPGGVALVQGGPEGWAGAPFWMRHTSLLVRTAYLVTAAASIVEVVRILLAPGSPVALVGLAVLLTGAIASWWRPLHGLTAVALGCVVLALGGWDPLTGWTVATFLAFIACVRTAAGWRVPVVLAPVLFCAVLIAEGLNPLNPVALVAALMAATAAATGTSLRVQREYWESLRQRAADAVATRELVADRRVVEERLRIARDLHDVLGHQIAVATMHLGVAEVRTPPEAHDAQVALRSVRADLRSVLTETQQILGVLRRGSDHQQAGSPAPGLADLDELVRSYEGLGLVVRARVSPPPSVPALVDVTAYRVVQEALTNAHRYGDGNADLEVGVRDRRLEIVVRNGRGPAPTEAGGGYGLVGMRERVEGLGGTLVVQDGATFGVRASFPVEERNGS